MFDDILMCMKDNKKEPYDVLYVNHESGSCSFDDLKNVICNYTGNYKFYEYPCEQLKIVGNDWFIAYFNNYIDEHYSEWRFHELPFKRTYALPTLYDDIIQKNP